MSLEALAGNAVMNRLDNTVVDAIARLERAINRQISFLPIPRVFLKSNSDNLSSNVADGTIILKGAPIPPKHRGTLEDFNINFTTAAGTVRLVILDSSSNIRIDVLRDITSSTNGTGKTVLEEGESFAVAGQSAGAGTFAAYVSGFLQRVRE